eukprot:COSAG05_NODE_476_length_9460_cov_8.847025_4_plen_211_part_00
MLLAALLLPPAAAAASASCNVTKHGGIAYPQSQGHAMPEFHGDAAACCALCAKNASCAAFTWRTEPQVVCFAHPTGKALGPPVQKGKGFASGIVRPGSIPPTPPPPPPLPPAPPQPIKPAPKGAKNVLFLISDDLRPEMLEAYKQGQMITPHFDKLARESLVLNRAYCQQAICGPTRNSFLSGRRPQRTQAWNFIGAYCCLGHRCICLLL